MKWIQIQRGQQTNKKRTKFGSFPLSEPEKQNKKTRHPEKSTLRKSKDTRFFFGASQCLPPQGDSLHPRNSSNCSGHAWTMGVSTSPFTLPETNSEFTPENGWSEYFFPFGARPIFFRGHFSLGSVTERKAFKCYLIKMEQNK